MRVQPDIEVDKIQQSITVRRCRKSALQRRHLPIYQCGIGMNPLLGRMSHRYPWRARRSWSSDMAHVTWVIWMETVVPSRVGSPGTEIREIGDWFGMARDFACDGNIGISP
jgi:hypothetical protein